jgi:hypothetical protein
MSNELVGEWMTYASFAIPGMMCFVFAIWDEWRDTDRYAAVPGDCTLDLRMADGRRLARE